MGGGKRRAHHAAVEAQRQAAQQAAEFERQMLAQERAQQAMVKSLEQQAKRYTPPAVSSAAQVGDTGIRPKKAKKSSALSRGRGISQLRIPLNVGQGSAGGTNVP